MSEVTKETKATKEVAAPKTCKVSMTVDGCHLIAGQACPELTPAAKEQLTKLFGSLDKVIG